MLRSRVGRKGLSEALKHAGLSATEVERYWFAWVCFKTVYTPTQTGIQRSPEPDRALWEAAAKLYNAERQNQLTVPGSPCSPEMIEQWMRKAATYVRTYLYPPVDSLSSTGEDGQETDLPTPQVHSGLDMVLIEEELQTRRHQQQQIGNLLATTVQQFDAEMQTILCLYYQQNQTQKQIADQIGISQPTVVRRLNKARDTLLTVLVKWSRDEMNISPTPDLVKDRGTALEEWLQLRYAE